MANSHALLKSLRQLHLYIGIFISPAVLFFAFTGSLQTFSLHETTKGSDYKPPAWAVKLGQLHKKQTLEVPQRKPGPPPSGEKPKGDRPPDAAGDAPKVAKAPDAAGEPVRQAAGYVTKAPDAPAPKPKSHLPMKIFFLIVAISLMISTLTGLYMAYKFGRNKWVVTALLVAGVVVPLLLLPF
jgi:hypothetical protein